MSFNVLIGADVAPVGYGKNTFLEGTSVLRGELKEIWNEADYRVFDLETPVTDVLSPIPKRGPNFAASKKTMNAVLDMKPDLVTVANNHILDQGREGFFRTLKNLEDNFIPYIGAEKSIKEHMNGFTTKTEDGFQIGWYACAEREFNFDRAFGCGATIYDSLDAVQAIRHLKETCKYVVVLYHGGTEYYQYPTPTVQSRARIMADAGADIVVCQHTHCIGCQETYGNSTLIYGQGNFCFDYGETEQAKEGLIIRVNFSNDQYDVDIIPITLKNGYTYIADKERTSSVREAYEKRSFQLLEDDFVQKSYAALAQRELQSYLDMIAPSSTLKKIARRLKLVFFFKKGYNTRKYLTIKNTLQCESHRELLIQGLTDFVEARR